MQETFQCYSGPRFIVGELVRAKGKAPMPFMGKKLPYCIYDNVPATWPYDVLTLPHEAGLLTENEKFDLLDAPDHAPEGRATQASGGEFDQHHLHRGNITQLEFEVNTKVQGSDAFYCTGKGCWACKKKEKVQKN